MAAILVKRRLWIVASLLALALSVAAILCVFAGTRIASANLVASLEDLRGGESFSEASQSFVCFLRFQKLTRMVAFGRESTSPWVWSPDQLVRNSLVD